MANPLVAPQIEKARMEQSNRLMDSAMNRMGIGSSMINKAITDTGQLYQDYRDAQYLNALNQYSNDPIGMSNALSSGSINARGVSRDTLNKVPEYLQNYSTAWKQNTETEDTRYMNDQNLQFSKEKALYNDLMKTGNANEAMKVAQDAIGRGANVRLFTQDPNYMRQQIAAQNYGTSVRAGELEYQRMQNAADMYAKALINTSGGDIQTLFGEGGVLKPESLIYIPKAFQTPEMLNMITRNIAVYATNGGFAGTPSYSPSTSTKTKSDNFNVFGNGSSDDGSNLTLDKSLNQNRALVGE